MRVALTGVNVFVITASIVIISAIKIIWHKVVVSTAIIVFRG